MPIYEAPVDSTLFILEEVLGLGREDALPGLADVTPELLRAILEGAAQLCEEVVAPLNAVGDREGCRRDPDGSVSTPSGFRDAYRAYRDGGWMGLSCPAEHGGQGLPTVINTAVQDFLSGANLAFGMYPGLTQGAIAALLAHGTDEQRRLFLPRMVTGEWTGTMNLTEPHCGTDLGLLRTKAVPNGDGSYAITGTKIFISAGDHDLSENIIHLVLARLQGAPAGTKGISLFVVPKVEVGPDGELAGPNRVSCGSLENKMGIHGNATCVMNYDGARGFLVGEANRGLQAMFVMMNEARLVVGVQGLGQSEAAYQNAAAYAKERLQGRALTGAASPERPADPIIVHPDIRRTLLSIRAFNEAARALALWTALATDIARSSPDPAERQKAEDRLGLLTPVVKGVLTDRGFDNTVAAQQVLGGHGYVAEWGMEQFVRDARIAMIYEGANGIQALDLVGRKLPRDGGRAMMAFFAEVEGFCRESGEDAAMATFVAPLAESLGHLQAATTWFIGNAMSKPDNAGAGATDFMHLLGLVALGYMWARMAKAALARTRDGGEAALAARLATGRVFMERSLPETALRLRRIQAGADAVMAMPAAMF